MEKFKLTRRSFKEMAVAYLFLLPLFTGIVLFFIIPIFQSFFYSLTDWRGVGAAKFIGIGNFSKLFSSDEVFGLEFKNTVVFVIGYVPATIFISLVISNLLNTKIKGVSAYRIIYFLPNVVMGVVTAMVWRWILNSQFGIVDAVLNALFGIRPAWLSDTKLTMLSMCMIAVWASLGYCVVIILSGLQGISPTYYEAATIDGANGLQLFWHITFPLVSPTLFFLLITRTIVAFNQFDLVYMLSGGEGPIQRSLRTMVFGIYQSGFQEFSMGYACAKAVVLFCIIMIITLFQFIGEKHWVNY